MKTKWYLHIFFVSIYKSKEQRFSLTKILKIYFGDHNNERTGLQNDHYTGYKEEKTKEGKRILQMN